MRKIAILLATLAPVFAQTPQLEIRNATQTGAELWLNGATTGSYYRLHRSTDLRESKDHLPVEVTSGAFKVQDITFDKQREFFTATVQEGFLIEKGFELATHSDHVVVVDENSETDNVWMYVVELEAFGPNVSIDDIRIMFELGEDNSLSDLDDIISSVSIKMDINGDVVGTVNLEGDGTCIVEVKDLDFLVEDGEMTDLIIEVDIRPRAGNYKNWDSLRVREVQIEYDAGSDSAVLTPEVPTDFIVLSTYGVIPEPDMTGSFNSFWMSGMWEFEFELTAFGEDAYIHRSNGVLFDVIDTNNSGFGNVSMTSTITSDADIQGEFFVINEGQTEQFSLSLNVDGSSSPDTFVGVFLRGARCNFVSLEEPAVEIRYGFPEDFGGYELIHGGEH